MEFDNQYLTYSEYKKLGGTLERTPFNILEFKARQNIDKYTFGRLKNLSEQVDEVKLCDYELMDTIQTFEDNNKKSKGLSSESTDGYSVTYTDLTNQLTDFQTNQIKNIIKTYLEQCKLEDGTPYLYIGVGGNYDYKQYYNVF